MSRMFVCGGTGAGLKYLDSVEVLDSQSGESEVFVTLGHLHQLFRHQKSCPIRFVLRLASSSTKFI